MATSAIIYRQKPWLFKLWLLSLMYVQTLDASVLYTKYNLGSSGNHSCIEEKLAELEANADSKFHYLTEISKISDGKILDYNVNTGIAQLLLHREVGNMSTYQIDHYLQTISVAISENGKVLTSTIENEEYISGLLFQDTDSFGNSARLFSKKVQILHDEYAIEEYLTVVTKDDKTSCTLRLSQFNSHGRVLTDENFGFFKFSPDGRYLICKIIWICLSS